MRVPIIYYNLYVYTRGPLCGHKDVVIVATTRRCCLAVIFFHCHNMYYTPHKLEDR